MFNVDNNILDDFEFLNEEELETNIDSNDSENELSSDEKITENDSVALDESQTDTQSGDERIQESSNENLTKESSEETIKEESLTEKEFIFPCLIGKKIGMTQLYSEDGLVFPTTVVQAGPCTVTQIKTYDVDGYDAIQLGYLDKKEKNTTKALIGHFNKSSSSPKKILKEFRIENKVENLSEGTMVSVNQFYEGDLITVSGFSKGKGFAGHMKRHGFSGGRASHGKNSVMRKSGSVGAGTSPGRIFPGMKMAGRMGNQKVSVKNLRILNIDKENNLIFIKGSLPGPNNKVIYLNKS